MEPWNIGVTVFNLATHEYLECLPHVTLGCHTFYNVLKPEKLNTVQEMENKIVTLICQFPFM